MKYNKKMSAILGMDDPGEGAAPAQELIVVEPHEIVDVQNPDLPDMHDIYRKQLQGEKQLEEVINFALGYQQTLFDGLETVDPKYRSRQIEVANSTLGIALDAIKTKIKIQENQRKLRMEEAKFVRPAKGDNSPEGGGEESTEPGTNNFFFGTREDLLQQIRNIQKGAKDGGS